MPLYYGDMKPANLLVYRNQFIKIGDFGTSIEMSMDEAREYKLKGLTFSMSNERLLTAVNSPYFFVRFEILRIEFTIKF